MKLFILIVRKFLIISAILLRPCIATTISGVMIGKYVLKWKWRVIGTITSRPTSAIWIHWEQPIIYIQKVHYFCDSTFIRIKLNFFCPKWLSLFKICVHYSITILKIVSQIFPYHDQYGKYSVFCIYLFIFLSIFIAFPWYYDNTNVCYIMRIKISIPVFI